MVGWPGAGEWAAAAGEPAKALAAAVSASMVIHTSAIPVRTRRQVVSARDTVYASEGGSPSPECSSSLQVTIRGRRVDSRSGGASPST
jgi:hypothetical protein